MINKNIVQIGDPVLRNKAKDVLLGEIKTKKIQSVLEKMKTVLDEEFDGVAIAAPQIGAPLRIFVMSGRAVDIANDDFKEGIKKSNDVVFINPVITKLSKKRDEMEEGCLSVRWKYGKVMRADKATVTAYDENGNKFTRGASGLIAQIFQHETDHLDGVLFIDKADDVVDLPPEKQKETNFKRKYK